MTLILNGRPAACSASARAAMATGTTFGAPAAVNPLTARVSVLAINKAASSAVSLVNDFITKSGQIAQEFYCLWVEKLHLAHGVPQLQAPLRIYPKELAGYERAVEV